MKLNIDRKDFLRTLTNVHNVVEKRNTIPILSNLLLHADGTRLTVTATDLDLEASDSADAQISADGATTAPAYTLFDIVKRIPQGAQISLNHDAENNRLHIQSGRSRFDLPTLDAEDFQTMANHNQDDTHFNIPADKLKYLINKTRFAISNEETRYYLNGIYLHHHDQNDTPTLRTVATDGHRLALAEIPAPPDTQNLNGIIIPRKTVGELIRLIDNNDHDVQIRASQTTISFQINNAILISKLIEGNFPDYARVIPPDNQTMLQIDNQQFANAVDRVAVVSSERARAVKLTASEGNLALSVRHSESGQGGDEDIAAQYDADTLEIGFNAKYLLDITNNIDGDNITFALKDGGSPALITDSSDNAARYVLMPLRV